jgi:hypothetical protein
MDVLRWARNQGCQWNKGVCLASATRNGHPEVARCQVCAGTIAGTVAGQARRTTQHPLSHHAAARTAQIVRARTAGIEKQA